MFAVFKQRFRLVCAELRLLFRNANIKINVFLHQCMMYSNTSGLKAIFDYIN